MAASSSSSSASAAAAAAPVDLTNDEQEETLINEVRVWPNTGSDALL